MVAFAITLKTWRSRHDMRRALRRSPVEAELVAPCKQEDQHEEPLLYEYAFVGGGGAKGDLEKFLRRDPAARGAARVLGEVDYDVIEWAKEVERRTGIPEEREFAKGDIAKVVRGPMTGKAGLVLAKRSHGRYVVYVDGTLELLVPASALELA